MRRDGHLIERHGAAQASLNDPHGLRIALILPTAARPARPLRPAYGLRTGLTRGPAHLATARPGPQAS